MARIERVSFRTAFGERVEEAARLPSVTIETTDLPQDVRVLLDHHLLDLGGIDGGPNAGLVKGVSAR